jgi:hypothetical protein
LSFWEEQVSEREFEMSIDEKLGRLFGHEIRASGRESRL